MKLLQRRIVARRFCKFKRKAESTSRTKPSPVHTKKRSRSVRVVLSVCQFGCSSYLKSRKKKRIETDHVAVNLQISRTVNLSRGGFSSVLLADSSVSRQFPTFHLKNRRTFTLFTTFFQKHQQKCTTRDIWKVSRNKSWFIAQKFLQMYISRNQQMCLVDVLQRGNREQ